MIRNLLLSGLHALGDRGLGVLAESTGKTVEQVQADMMATYVASTAGARAKLEELGYGVVSETDDAIHGDLGVALSVMHIMAAFNVVEQVVPENIETGETDSVK